MQATLGVRMAEPLASNGFTPAFDPRRYLGVGPRIGFEGNKPLQSSWVVEWKVGAAVLSGDRTFDTGGGVANPLLPNYASSGSALNVDGLLGLSYWFDSAVETDGRLSRRLFQRRRRPSTSPAPRRTARRINHGPMIRFSIQK